MKVKFVKTFEGRMAFYIFISILVTAVVDSIFYRLLLTLSAKIRSIGYRSSIAGPDGLNETFRSGVLVLITITVFVFTFYLFIKKYMKYVRMLTNSMQDIAEGNFDTEISEELQDEFGQIACNMVKMQKNIKMIMEKERKDEQIKNDLISSVAHDLRTPLTSIIGYIGWVREKPDMDAQTRQKFLDIAYRKAQYLEKMTNELFGFVKLEHREMSIHVGKLDLLQLLRQLIDESCPSFEKNGLTSRLITKEKECQIDGDGNLLARLFDNLINNAVKYGKDGKMITVELEKEDKNVIVRVTNYGKVIPQSEIANLFRKFYRVEQSRSQDTGGTGLGLAIVEQIVQLHHGSIQVRSDLAGTVFKVTLPKKYEEKNA